LWENEGPLARKKGVRPTRLRTWRAQTHRRQKSTTPKQSDQWGSHIRVNGNRCEWNRLSSTSKGRGNTAARPRGGQEEGPQSSTRKLPTEVKREEQKRIGKNPSEASTKKEGWEIGLKKKGRKNHQNRPGERQGRGQKNGIGDGLKNFQNQANY